MAPREEDKAMAGLLRRSLAQDAGSGSGEDCPAPEILAAYFDRALDAQETSRYELHFSRCSTCREQLAAMARAGGVDVAEKKTVGAWYWLTGPRWLMPAAAMMVALLVFAGIDWRIWRPVAPVNQIAMSRPDALPSPNSEPPANPASRESSASSPDVASAQSPVEQTAPPQPQTMARQQNSEMVRGGMRAGSASAAAAAPVTTADETASVSSAAPALDTTVSPAAPPTKKSEARSMESDTSAAVQAYEAKESNAPKTKLPVTAVPAQSVSAANLTVSQTTEVAALAKLQEAQVSSNLINPQILTPDPKIFWLIEPGAIGRSEDGGASWKTEYLNVRAPILAGAAPTVKICWLVGTNGTILRTTNGTHWKTISPPAETDFVRVEAADTLTATVTAMDGRRFSTSDGGKHWIIAK